MKLQTLSRMTLFVWCSKKPKSPIFHYGFLMLSRGYRKGPLETNDRRKLILNMTVKFEYTWEYITNPEPKILELCAYKFI